MWSYGINLVFLCLFILIKQLEIVHYIAKDIISICTTWLLVRIRDNSNFQYFDWLEN